MMAKYYEFRHTVGLEESNLVGNVYFVNPIRWQGRCRELFLRDHAPGVLKQLRAGLSLVTVRCACEYYAELFPFDEISTRLFLAGINLNRVQLRFEYWRVSEPLAEHVAGGTQEIACMERGLDSFHPVPVPDELVEALRPYCSTNAPRISVAAAVGERG